MASMKLLSFGHIPLLNHSAVSPRAGHLGLWLGSLAQHSVMILYTSRGAK